MEFKVSKALLTHLRGRYVLNKIDTEVKLIEEASNLSHIVNMDGSLPFLYFSSLAHNPLWAFTLVCPYGYRTPHDLEAFKILIQTTFDIDEIPYIEIPPVVCIGAGGAVSQFLYVIDRLARIWPNRIKLPKRIKVYDDDKVEWSNLPRLPYQEYNKNPLGKYKVEVLRDSLPVLGNILEIHNKRLEKFNKKYFYIGAPDIETRKLLADIDAKFLMIGHHTNEILFDPKYLEDFDDSIIQETYGLINLAFFGIGFVIGTVAYLINNDTILVEKIGNINQEDSMEIINEIHIKYGENKIKIPQVAYDYNYYFSLGGVK